MIKPQHAVRRLHALTKHRETYITTEVGQHQMWAAQHYDFEEPNRWMTSGGLGTMGYGLPAAIGAQMAHPNALVIDIAGEGSILMNMQEMSTAAQYRLPVKIFILNNEYLGMVRQWQELLHEKPLLGELLAGAARLREAGRGLWRARHPRVGPGRPRRGDRGDDRPPGPVIVDCLVDKTENCFPMIPSGKAHNEMILADEHDLQIETVIDAKGRELV